MTRINLTHWAGLAASVSFVVACGSSHGPSGDGGTGTDGGRPPADRSDPSDGGSPPIDGGGGVDSGLPRGSCDAQLAAAMTCPPASCDGPPSWHWNGDTCFPIGCGECAGADCEAGWTSEAECIAAHTECEASICRDTGGDWLWWAEECGHYECGVAPPASCLVGFPVCDCGPNRRFEPGTGCVSADCGDPPPRTPETACTSTRGTWESICCHTTCGAFCPAACLGPACNCGPGRVFDDARGCIESAECHDRGAGETCEGTARCPFGTICCRHFGGAGELGPPTCEAPVCDDNPDIDECGNNLLAP